MTYKLNLSPSVVKEDIKTGAQLSQLRRDKPDHLIAGLTVLLTDLNDFMNVKRQLNTAQIGGLSVMIAQTWWYFRLSEIIYVLEKAKRGGYGLNFESISPDKVMGWFAEYDTTDRLDFVAQNRTESEEQRTAEEDAKFYAAYQESRATGKSFVGEQASKARERSEKARRDANSAAPGIIASEQNSKRIRDLWGKFFEDNPKASEDDFWKYERATRPEMKL